MKIIIISGPSGSGKTSLSKNIFKKVKNVIVLNTDNYYKTDIKSRVFSKIIDSYFDRKISFNIKLLSKHLDFILKNSFSSYSYDYDFRKKSIKKIFKKTNNIDLIIIEGIFATEIIKKYSHKIHLLIQLETKKETCMRRVIERDTLERGKKKSNAYKNFIKGWDLFHKYKKNNHFLGNIKNIIISDQNNIDLILKKITT